MQLQFASHARVGQATPANLQRIDGLLTYGEEVNRSEGVGFSYGRIKVTRSM